MIFFFLIDFWSISLFVLTFCLKYFCLNFGIGFVCVHTRLCVSMCVFIFLKCSSSYFMLHWEASQPLFVPPPSPACFFLLSSPVYFVSLTYSFCAFLLSFTSSSPLCSPLLKNPCRCILYLFTCPIPYIILILFLFFFFFAISSWFRWLFLLTFCFPVKELLLSLTLNKHWNQLGGEGVLELVAAFPHFLIHQRHLF